MPTYLFIHPFVSALAGLLILVAFLTKFGQRRLFAWHYFIGTLAIIIVGSTIAVASGAISRFYADTNGDVGLLDVFNPHRIIAFLVFILVVFQGILGWFLNLKTTASATLIAIHRWSARILVVLVICTGVVGLIALTTFIEFTPEEIGRTLIVVTIIGFSCGFTVWTASIRKNKQYKFRRISTKAQDQKKPPTDIRIGIHYHPDDLLVKTSPKSSILYTSLQAGIPHTHVCGGNARYSTCRVLVLGGLEHCSPRNNREKAMAEKLHFSDDIR
ncbi:MAG: hypothetical protein ISR58_00675 [Anaerolineales bacterium]|nr:hypothetical protein [Chloroflexota bacterium]MBL6979677.1 hypothetical protein [Anaerolineales bacterium]